MLRVLGGASQFTQEIFISLLPRRSRLGVTGFFHPIMAFGIERRDTPHDDICRDKFSRRLSHLGPFFNIGTGAIFLEAMNEHEPPQYDFPNLQDKLRSSSAKN